MSESSTDRVPYQFCNALVTAHIPIACAREDWDALLDELCRRAGDARGRGEITCWRGQCEIGADAAARAAATGEAPRGHVQFFISSRSKATIRGWKQRLIAIFGSAIGEGAHIECARDSAAAWDYCGKDDTRAVGPRQVGERPQGRAGGAAKASAAAAERRASKSSAIHELVFGRRLRLEDIVTHEEHGPGTTFHTEHIRRCIAIRDGADGAREEGQAPPRLWFLHGATGAGKTRFAMALAGGRGLVFVKEGQTHWWCGYEPARHKVILFDEASEASLRRCCCDISWFLRAGDHWDCCTLPRRGVAPIEGIGKATTDIVVTTNLPLRDVIRGSEEQWAAIRRRGLDFGGGNLRFIERGGDGRSRAFAEWANFGPELAAQLRPSMVVWDDASGQAASLCDLFRVDLLSTARAGLPGGGAQDHAAGDSIQRVDSGGAQGLGGSGGASASAAGANHDAETVPESVHSLRMLRQSDMPSSWEGERRFEGGGDDLSVHSSQ